MRITYSFSSLQDLSDLSSGEKLLKILSTNGLIVEKADDSEPIRKEFDETLLSDYWKGVGLPGEHLACYFLFKGQKEIKFSGMAIWKKNLGPKTNNFNCLLLKINIPQKYDVRKLITLGDELFAWSGAVYGYISEDSKNGAMVVQGGLYSGIPDLLWVNYFGSSYLMEPDFYLPAGNFSVGNGVRVHLSDNPNDDKLADSSFLQSSKEQFGVEWFWKGSPNKRRRPAFDHSALIRPQT